MKYRLPRNVFLHYLHTLVTIIVARHNGSVTVESPSVVNRYYYYLNLDSRVMECIRVLRNVFREVKWKMCSITPQYFISPFLPSSAIHSQWKNAFEWYHNLICIITVTI